MTFGCPISNEVTGSSFFFLHICSIPSAYECGNEFSHVFEIESRDSATAIEQGSRSQIVLSPLMVIICGSFGRGHLNWSEERNVRPLDLRNGN